MSEITKIRNGSDRILYQYGTLCASGVEIQPIPIKSPKYEIGERVYHITKESSQGVVIDASFHLRFKYWVYTVTFTPGDNGVDFFEDELSKTKIF